MFGGGGHADALGPEREERVGREKTCDRELVVRFLQEASAARPQVLHPLLGRPVPDRSRPPRRHHQHAGERTKLVVDRRAAFLVILERKAVLLEPAVAGGEVADPLVQPGQEVGLDEVERRANVANRFERGACGDGNVGGFDQPLRGLLPRPLRVLGVRLESHIEDGRRAVVEGQDLGQGNLPARRDRLDPPRGLRVQARPLGARQRAVGDLLDEDVAERIPVALGRANEVAVGEVLAQLEDMLVEPRLQSPHPTRAESAAEHAAQLEDAPLADR